jgi:tetratricopeptide (TPR) repeat protein
MLFSSARTQIPDHAMTLLYIGKSLYHMGKYTESTGYLKKSIELHPGNKEVLFLLANALNESGKTDSALKVFSHLRPDPLYGPSSSLESGKINMTKRNFIKAIEDFEIGLKHKTIEGEIKISLLYMLALTYIKENSINEALNLFNMVTQINPDYKDVKSLKRKYLELASNKNLKIYMMSPTSEFVNLCRKLTPRFFPGEHIKITDITAAKNDYVDITAELSSDHSEDIALIRFIRSSASVGDIMLRDLYFKSKDVRAGKSLCITAGTFTDTAEKFVEARTIDLIDSKKLMALLSSVSSN